MLFNSFEFALFLAIVLVLYSCLSRSRQNTMLLLASYIFYAFWSWKYAFLLFGTSVMDFVVSHLIARAPSPTRRRLWLGAALSINLGVLGLFKYHDFFVVEAAKALALSGFSVHPSVLRLALPVGLSFLTFQEMGYTIDVYRGQMAPASSFRDYLLFVAYFPHLVAGPIQRSSHLLAQLSRPRIVRPDQVHTGLILLLSGLFRKVVVADSLAPYVDVVYSSPSRATGSSLAVATFLFAFQIYCDFAGYSEMAVGMSRLLGIELIYNFRSPYLATSIKEFWRRWHISLSTWFRDYLFIPLGGSRGSLAREIRNTIIVFVVSGLWHGANWTFVVWGAVHGVCSVIQRVTTAIVPSARFPALVGRLVTFSVVVVAWVFFRASSVGDAWAVLTGFGRSGRPYWSPAVASGLLGLTLMMAAEVASSGLPFDQWLVRRRPAMQLVVGVVIALSIVLLGVRNGAQFIYFQF